MSGVYVCFRGSWKYEELKACAHRYVCLSFLCLDAEMQTCIYVKCRAVYVCVRVLKSYASRAELQCAFHMPKKTVVGRGR